VRPAARRGALAMSAGRAGRPVPDGAGRLAAPRRVRGGEGGRGRERVLGEVVAHALELPGPTKDRLDEGVPADRLVARADRLQHTVGVGLALGLREETAEQRPFFRLVHVGELQAGVEAPSERERRVIRSVVSRGGLRDKSSIPEHTPYVSLGLAW